MTGPHRNLCVFETGTRITFLVEGRATMHQGHTLRQFAEDAATRGSRQVRIDLRHCTYMDSTFIGTLLLLHKSAKATGGLALLCPSSACKKLLGDMCLDRVLPSETADELPAASWMELNSTAQVTRPFAANIYDAHVALADLPGPTGAQFQCVVQCLAKDME